MNNQDDKQPSEEMIIDRVDDNDEVIGPIQRKNIFRERANFRTVHVFIFNENGELLLQKIATGKERHPGYWGSSTAGYLFSGETYGQAALRKLKQELGLDNIELKNIGKTKMEDAGSVKFITLFSTVHNGPFSPDPSQIEEVKFFPLSEILKLAKSGDSKLTPTFLHLFDFYQSKK